MNRATKSKMSLMMISRIPQSNSLLELEHLDHLIAQRYGPHRLAIKRSKCSAELFYVHGRMLLDSGLTTDAFRQHIEDIKTPEGEHAYDCLLNLTGPWIRGDSLQHDETWIKHVAKSLQLKFLGRFLFDVVLRYIERAHFARVPTSTESLSAIAERMSECSAVCAEVHVEKRVLIKALRIGGRAQKMMIWTGRVPEIPLIPHLVNVSQACDFDKFRQMSKLKKVQTELSIEEAVLFQHYLAMLKAHDYYINGTVSVGGGGYSGGGMLENVNKIAEGMHKHIWHTGIQQASCDILWHYASGSLRLWNKDIVIPQVIECLLATMKAHLMVVEVQETACAVLDNLSVDRKVSVQIVTAGGIERVLVAMIAHPDANGLQENCARTLVNLSADDTATQLKISRAGGIRRVVSAMVLHPKVVDVQLYTCWSLCNLATNSVHRAQIVAEGGIEQILTAMSAHRKAAKVQEYACAALSALAADYDIAAEICTGHRGIDGILGAMREHPVSFKVQRNACEALGNLASCNSVRQALKTFNGILSAMTVLEDLIGREEKLKSIKSVLSAMTAHPSAAEVQEAGCKVLRSLSKKLAAADCIITVRELECIRCAMAAAGATETTKILGRKLLGIFLKIDV